MTERTSTPDGAVRWYPIRTGADAAGRVARAFHAAYGYPPDGVWAAPGRVNLIGEHVDYNAGRCLPLALPHRTFVALALRGDDTVRARSPHLHDDLTTGAEGDDDAGGDARPGTGGTAALPPDVRWQGGLDQIRPGAVEGWAGYVAGVPWALAQAGHVVRGFDAEIHSWVPVGSGLSSSAALECAVALALDEALGLGLGADDAGRALLAAACVDAENQIAGAPTGGLDQAAALRCRAGHALGLDCRDGRVRQVPLDLAGAGLELLVMDTRAHHALTDGRYGSRRSACEEACRLLGVAALGDLAPADLDAALELITVAAEPDRAQELRRRVRHVVTEIARVDDAVALLQSGRVEEIGPLLDASHASLRDDYQVSCPELDVACEAARAAGALGARMTGGGFGGSAIALVAAGTAGQVAQAVHRAFAASGFAAPAFLRARAADPAARVT